MDVSQFVEQMLSMAIEKRSSDIHIQPKEKKGDIYFRIDGVLTEWRSCSSEQLLAIISKLKYIAHMDIGEKRFPQDGSLNQTVNKIKIHMRLSTFPTIYGEKLVARLFPLVQDQLSLAHLGFTTQQLAYLEKMMQVPHGLLLIVGPTGSGKTTTLYKILERLAEQKGKNIISLEDPVEMRLPSLTQAQVNPGHGFTFATGLRAILRQDPDIIFVGEIRDGETAEIAIRASLTGHFVLSSLHTPSTTGAIVRLLEMGMKPYYVASALKGVIAQRLFRLRCPYCSTGCYSCFYTGYAGRRGVFEVLPIFPLIKDEISKGGREERLKQLSKELKIPSLAYQLQKHTATLLTTEKECYSLLLAEEWEGNV